MTVSICRRNVAALALAAVLFVPVVGCQPREGPGERAGKDVDKAVGDIGKQMEKAGEEIQDAAKGAKREEGKLADKP